MSSTAWNGHASGVAVFGVLFVVYGSSLAYAELATVTFGWILMLQIGVVVLLRVQDGTPVGVDRVSPPWP